MKSQKTTLILFIAIGFILFAATFRIANAAQISSTPNFSPIGAMALFAGTYFTSRWKGILFPLLALFLSDIFINKIIYDGTYGLFYDQWYVVYGIMAIVVFVGATLIKKVTIKNILLGTFASTLLYWGLIDFTYWASGGINLATSQPFSRSISGLLGAYVQGFPFIKNFAIGTMLFSFLMYGGFEFLRSYILEKETVKVKNN